MTNVASNSHAAKSGDFHRDEANRPKEIGAKWNKFSGQDPALRTRWAFLKRCTPWIMPPRPSCSITARRLSCSRRRARTPGASHLGTNDLHAQPMPSVSPSRSYRRSFSVAPILKSMKPDTRARRYVICTRASTILLFDALRLDPDDRTHAEQDRGLQQTFSVEGCRPNPA